MKINKVDVKSTKCVDLGLSEDIKPWKLYDPIEKKILISMDVVFEESNGREVSKSHKKKNA